MLEASHALLQMVASGRAEVLRGGHVCPPAGGKQAGESPHAKLKKALAALAAKEGIDLGGSEVPLKRWEELGNLALCPGDWTEYPPWSLLPQSRVWQCIAESLGMERIAVKDEVDQGPMRQSHAVIVHPPGETDGWVKSVQHGHSFEWDVTKVMFSRGNVNERKRMGSLQARGEIFVDLFCGIGYFTIPLLASGGAEKAYVCEWNPGTLLLSVPCLQPDWHC